MTFVFNKRETQGVAQVHSLGCSVACVAYRCGFYYDRALSLFTFPSHAWTRGYYCSEIIEALARAGFHYEYTEYDKNRHVELLQREGTIIFINSCEQYPVGHYMIFTRHGWMNSWANFPVMIPVKAEFQRLLVADVAYVIFERET